MSLVFTLAFVALTLDSYFKLTTVTAIAEGSNTDFFRTSPEGGCWFAPDYEACLEDTILS